MQVPHKDTSPPNGERRAARPKPPKDEDAEQLLRLCREGRLFEPQTWVAAGRPLTVPTTYRRTPRRAALETGFHSLIEFLLQQQTDQAAKDEFLRESCWRGQGAITRLAISYGARVSAVPFQDVIETWDRSLAQLFVERGADPVTNAPFARAFKHRIRRVLGIFLDCKRARPDLADAQQEQIDTALRQACYDDDLRWVSLLMWLGANPRTKGVATDNLDHPDVCEEPSCQRSALQIACNGRKPEILRRLGPDPTVDDLGELLAAATSFILPETVGYLVTLGADINDRPDGSSPVLDNCLRSFGWRESVLDIPWPYTQRGTVPLSRLTASLDSLRFIVEKGARWAPDEQSITDVRRALYRLDGEAISVVIDVLCAHNAGDDASLKALTRTDKMRKLLAAARQRQADIRVRAKGRSRRL
jgi:hypothetical protein